MIEREYVVVQKGASLDTLDPARMDGESVHLGRVPDRLILEAAIRSPCDNANGIQTGPFGSQLHQRDYGASRWNTYRGPWSTLGRILSSIRSIPYLADDDRRQAFKIRSS